MKQRWKHLILMALMLTSAAMAAVMRPTGSLADDRAPIDLEAMVPTQFGEWREQQGVPVQIVDPEMQQTIDAIYTPIRKVEYHVGSARVGQSVNLDRLLLRVWTDGTITAEDAVVRSAQILVEQFRLFAQLAPDFREPEVEVVSSRFVRS